LAIYQPTGTTFPEEYRQKLLDAGFVFDFFSEKQLPKVTHESCGLLVIPETASLPKEEIERLHFLSFAFLEKAPELPESIEQRRVISLTVLNENR